MDEIWRDIKGYEGLYQASNLGRVKSWIDNHGNRRKEPKILKPFLEGRGYQQVCLCKNGKRKFCRVHRLVYEAFNGKVPEGMEINHISECKTENSLSNLNLLTHKENMNWGTAIERMTKANSKSVVQKSLDGKVIRIWPSTIEIQRELGYGQGNISICCRGGHYLRGKWVNVSQMYGFIWQYER